MRGGAQMERGLFVVSLIVSLGVWGIGLAPPRKDAAFPWFAALPGLVAFLLTLPQSGWFALGQALGIGLVVGTLLGTLSGWMALQGRGAASLPLASVGIALVGLSRTLFPVDTLLGVALGFVGTQTTLALLRPQALSTLVLASGTSVAALSAAALGVYRANGGAPTPWLAVPAVFLALGGVLVAVRERIVPHERRGLACLGGALLLLLALRPLLLPLHATATVLAACGAVGVLLAALLTGQGSGEAGDKRTLGAFLTLASVLLAAHLGQGFGVALLAVGLGVGIALCESAEALALPLTVAVLTALWRLFAQRWTSVRTISLHEQYLLLGLLVGGLLPSVVARLAARRPDVAGILKSGSLLLGVPLIVTVLYGPSAALALLLGQLAVTLWRSATEPPTPSLAPLFSLAVATSLTQLLGHLEPLSEGSRLERLKLSGITLAVVLIFFFGSRLLRKKTS